MNKKMSKRQRDLKAKLMAAICMLLVSSIMMVSTTYAWFTLSTAPEVTGITTAVGANGNLEMALLPENADLAKLDDPNAEGGITAEVGDSVATTNSYMESNVTWGNLVDLTYGYGLDQISLYPSALNVDDSGTKINTTAMLKTPTYGADGRVAALTAESVLGMYKNNAFTAIEEGFGVRAIGKSASMTPRESSYRVARSNINSYIDSAKGNISTALNKHGTVLADPVLKEAMGTPIDTYSQNEVAGLDGLVKGMEDALVNVEKAYMNAILAYAASGLNDSDTVWEAVAALVNADKATLASVRAGLATAGFDASALSLSNYDALVSTVSNLRTKVDELAGMGKEVPKQSFTNVAYLLADPDNMKVGGYTADQIKADMNSLMGELMDKATSGTLVVTLAGGGAFGDFADHIGDYTASVKIQSVGMNTTMEVKTSVPGGGYLPAVYTTVKANEPKKDNGNAVQTLSDFYGYVIDMAFRTNAADSDLMLQIDPTDRIYSDNPGEATMGGGSYMEFTSGSASFTMEQMENLMDAIKIVFFNPGNGDIIANAYLDTEGAQANGNKIKAEIHMVEGGSVSSVPGFAHHDGKRYYGTVATAAVDGNANKTQYTYTYTNSQGAEVLKEMVIKTVTPESVGEDDVVIPEKTEWGTPIYQKYEGGAWVEITDPDAIAKQKVVKAAEGELIMSLTQNEAAAVSVLVYLDGNSVTNADVAFDANNSMTGTMNLQFCSSANLEPMKYSGDMTLPENVAPTTTAPAGTTTPEETTAPEETTTPATT